MLGGLDFLVCEGRKVGGGCYIGVSGGVTRGIKALFGGRRRVLWYGRRVDSSGSW